MTSDEAVSWCMANNAEVSFYDGAYPNVSIRLKDALVGSGVNFLMAVSNAQKYVAAAEEVRRLERVMEHAQNGTVGSLV